MRRLYILGSIWCGVCSETYSKLLEWLGEDRVFYVDLDKYPHLQERFDVRALPTAVVEEGGRILAVKIPDKPDDLLNLYNEPISNYDYTRRCIFREASQPKKDDFLRVIRFIEEIFDWQYGGLVGAYKLVPYRELDFLIKAYLDTGIKGYLAMVHRTIDIVLQSEMVDYDSMRISHSSMTPDWDTPDKVYLVEDQAEMARLLTWLHILTDRHVYLDLAQRFFESTLDYINRGWRAVVDGKPIEWGGGLSQPYLEALYNLSETGVSPQLREMLGRLRHLVPTKEKVLDKPLYTQLTYVNLLLSLYKYINWSRLLGDAEHVMNSILRWIGGYPALDAPKPIHGALDKWVCRPCRANLLLIYTCLRMLKYGFDMCGEAVDRLLRYRWEVLWRNSTDTALYGLDTAIFLNDLDVVEIYGYGKIPSKISESIKPYTEIIYRDGERRVEYISRGFRFKI